MCGICGKYNFIDQKPVEAELIEKMTRVLAHRGPDDEGYYISGPVGLGFRRLSIIDLEGGRQPMSDQEKKVWVIFNGEIYNFKELRRELEGFGHIFQTKSDTEVIIHGYKQWGTDILHHLNGMFGLAIWDEKAKKLIIARDPMGIKLVYYRIEAGCVYFASEIRSILSAGNTKPDIDPLALNLFLRYRYTPSPLTLFKGLFKLAPGTMLVFEDGRPRLERWYRYRPVHFPDGKSDAEAEEELLELYKKALKRHLISDVPLGLLLSGGIDSGLLLAFMNLYGRSWRTFSIGYGKGYKDDELIEASRTADIFSSDHTSVQIDRDTFEATLPKVLSFLEEPVATSSIVPMYFVCQRAREDVKVALIGQGPDELFGGYRRHIGVHYGGFWRNLPEWMKRSVTATIHTLPRNEPLKRGVYSLSIPDRWKRYQHVFSIMPGEEIDELFHSDLLPNAPGDKILDCWEELEELMGGTDDLGGLQFLEVRSSLPDELLMYADKLSMAHGLEVRVPYLDREIVEYVEKLPARFKIRYGTRKWLHRQICGDMLPREIVKRKKRGFGSTVVDAWFRESKSKTMDYLLLHEESLMYNWLRKDAIRKILMEHRNGKKDNHKILFSLVALEEWLRSTSH